MQLFEVEFDGHFFGVEFDVQLFGDGLVLGTRSFEVRSHDGVEPLLKIAARLSLC